MAVVVFTFVLIAGIVFGMYWALVVRPENNEHAELRGRLRGVRPAAATAVGRLEKRELKLSDVKLLETLLTRSATISDPINRLITQPGMNISVGTFVLSSLLLPFVAFLIVQWWTYSSLLGLLVAPL